MNFSLEIGLKTDLNTLPNIKDVYITLLRGDQYKDVASKAKELVRLGKNPVPHFPARSIKNQNELKDYVSMCKDFGVKQALVIGGGADPIGDYHCSLQILESGLFEGMKIGIAGHPEGSPDISESDLEKAMTDKMPFADYIVTQWLLDSKSIEKFISKQTLPVHVGITGPLKISSLLKFASIVGAKNSLNFLYSPLNRQKLSEEQQYFHARHYFHRFLQLFHPKHLLGKEFQIYI